MNHGPVFEVKKNAAGKWYWHEVAGGQVTSVGEAYHSKWNAKRAAIRKASITAGATWRIAA